MRTHRVFLVLLPVQLCIAAAGAPGAAVRIGVSRTGWYRLSGADLAKAGVPLGDIDARTLRLFGPPNPPEPGGATGGPLKPPELGGAEASPPEFGGVGGGTEVAIRVFGEDDGRLSPEDLIGFYGVGLDTDYTDTNVYWLTWGAGKGRRAPSRPADPRNPPGFGGGGGDGEPVRALPTTRRFEENHRYGKLIYVADPRGVPHWFWELVVAKERKEFRIAADCVVPGVPARVTVGLWGNTLSFTADPDHHTRVFWNGKLLEDATWDGQVGHRVAADLPAGAVREGENILAIECPADTAAGDVDQVFLDWVELSYARRLELSGPQMEIAVPAAAGQVLAISGASAETTVLDVTDPSEPVRIEGGVVAGGALPFRTGREAPCTLLVVKEAMAPAWVRRDVPSNLRDPANGADYLVVAADDLVDAIAPLAEHRREQGLRVVVARVSDVYDEFSGGVFSPAAIRDFVRHAWGKWARPAPRFLLLVGDANYDYRDYLGTGVRNGVPSYLAHVPGSPPTATDSFFACVAGTDHVPELAVGRLPADTPAEAAAVVRKILRYEQAAPGEWSKRVLFVADHDGETDAVGAYESICRSLADQAKAAGLSARLLSLRDVDPRLQLDQRNTQVREKLTPRIVAALNEGTAIVEFQGHGNEGYWSRQRVFDASDLAKLKAAAGLPFCVDISCFTGWFDKPDRPDGDSLAERLLLMPDAGAIAYVAPTRLGGINLDVQLIPYLLAHPDTPIGVAFQEARRGLLGSQNPDVWDAVETYNLLGDPALRLKR